MRKLIIGGLTAVLSVALASVALAQAVPPSATMTASVSPSKAGTRSNPKPSRVKLFVQNDRASNTTMSKLEITLPRNAKFNGRGFSSCSAAKVEATPSQCAGAKAGTGVANAILGPTSPTPSNLRFNVTAYVGGRSSLVFYLVQQGGAVKRSIPATISGRKLTLTVPADLQQPAPNVYSALVDLSANIYKKKGDDSLFTTTGCPPNDKHAFAAKLTYAQRTRRRRRPPPPDGDDVALLLSLGSQ